MAKNSEATQSILSTGLCGTCDQAPRCIYLRTATSAIQHCEEYALPAEEPPAPTASAQPMATLPTSRSLAGSNSGLCGDCSHREGCMYLRPEGGVWSCGEYA